MSRFLASVSNLEEARLVLPHADIIDLKNPMEGALGALPLDVIETIVRYVDGRKPVSATIGDLPMEPKQVIAAIHAVAATGVDIVKIGMFEGQQQACIDAMQPIANSGIKLVAVLFADSVIKPVELEVFSNAGFYGVMQDTAVKNGSSILDHQSPSLLRGFVAEARRLGLLCGLAGSLRLQQVSELAALEPDYLGFRGALCDHSDRKTRISAASVIAVKDVLLKNNIALKGALAV